MTKFNNGEINMKDQEIEKVLLNDKQYDSLIKSKLEKEFKNAFNSDERKNKVIKDIKKVPASELFSKRAVYLVLNKENKTKSYINGIQAEGFLGSQTLQREKLVSKDTDYFISGNSYIKFYSWSE